MSDPTSDLHTRDPLPLRPMPPTFPSADLPRPLTSFIGREREIALIVELLATRDVRLVTLTGTGGVGKTRLGLIVATQLVDAFADGVVFVPLDSILDPSLAPAILAQEIGVPDKQGTSLSQRIRTFLQTRSLLLVLDNLEHLPDTAHFVADLLAHSHELTILCTSRARLGISGEQVVPVASLGASAARHLFEQRAHAINPDFALTEAVIPVVDEICERLDGLPLAIELAAARIDVLPPNALLERIGHRLPLLTGGPKDAPVRQQSMRETIGWSFDLLEPGEQVLLRRLSVFVGGFSLDAAGAVVEFGADILGGVSALVSNGLVKPVQGPNDEPRFQVLETIREFALEHLAESGEQTWIRGMHATWCMTMAEAEIPNFDGPDLRTAHDRIEVELGNCRASLAWSLDAGKGEIGIRLAGALWRNWWYGRVTGGRPWVERVTEGLAWLERTLAMRDGIPVAFLTEAMAGAAHLARMLGDVDRGQELAEELLIRARAEPYPYGVFWSLHVLGWIAESRGLANEATRLYTQAQGATPGIRNPQNHRAMTLVRMSGMAERNGDLECAANGFAEALALYRECGNPAGLATAAFNLGRNRRKQADLGQAAQLLGEGLTGFVNQRDQGGVHASLVELALVAMLVNQVKLGVRMLSTAKTFPGHPDCRPTWDQAESMAHGRLDGRVYDAEWHVARQLSWDEVLGEVDQLAAAASDARPISIARPDPESGLTTRECEVLALLADGRSNRNIAEQLSISQRTVEKHVLHILTKLDLDSRTAAAAYAVRNGLA